jgi:DNA segregation ATPase FtsK/SpoIIIE, S-DNA-T family
LMGGGVMGSGKSGFLSNIIGHISQTTDCRAIGIDGKLVELMMWQDALDFVVGRDPSLANHVLRQLVKEMERRYQSLSRDRRRKIRRGDGMELIFLIIDELAAFTSLFGTLQTQEEFISLLLELVALGRAVGIVVIAATQRPSASVVPTKLRDIFSYRCAFRCATPASSDMILGDQYSDLGYDASKLDLSAPGVGYFMAEEARPFKFRSAYLNDDEIDTLVARSMSIRHHWMNGGAAA